MCGPKSIQEYLMTMSLARVKAIPAAACKHALNQSERSYTTGASGFLGPSKTLFNPYPFVQEGEDSLLDASFLLTVEVFLLTARLFFLRLFAWVCFAYG